MATRNTSALVVLLAVLTLTMMVSPANAVDLQVSNVRVNFDEGTGRVEVTYDLQTADAAAATVYLSLSTDGGVSYPLVCQQVTGDVGAGILPGTGKQIVWDATTESPSLSSDHCRLRVSADDGAIDGDMHTVVFTTQNPNAVAYPNAANHQDSVRVQSLITAIANADAVYRLGTGFDVPTFAYGEIDHTSPDGYKDPNGFAMGMVCEGSELRNDVRYLNLRFAQPNRRAELFYIPWQDFLPPNVLIESATLNVETSMNNYFTYPDYIISVQIDNPWDAHWFESKGVDTNYPDYAHVCWNRQSSTNGGNWTGIDEFPWVPSLDDRRNLWQWGETNDWTGTTNASPTHYLPQRTNVEIKITNCVQSVVSGGANFGILMCYAEHVGPGVFKHYAWDDWSSALGRTPYVVVQYRAAPPEKRFGTSDWAFIASTDDGKFPANSAYADTFLAHGGKYTIFVAQTQIGSGSGACTASQVLDFYSRGMEIGNHSRYHLLPYGLMNYTRLMTMPDTMSTAWSMLKHDVAPNWMYAMADTIVGDLRGEPYFAKSFATPTNSWSPESLLALEKYHYGAIRVAAATGQYNRDYYYVVGSQRPGRTDTLMTGVPTQSRYKPRNMLGVPNFDWLPAIVSYKANRSTSQVELDSLKTNVHKAVFQLRGQDRGALSLYWHDFKTNPSSNGYGDGLDANELGAICQVVDALGGRYMTVSEYTNWIKSRATAVATPVSYAQPDTFRLEATDWVWFKPDH